MKLSQNFYTAVKITFVLFGIVPMIGFMIFGDLPSLTVMESEISWIEADVILGILFFVGYLAISSISGNKTRKSSTKIHA